MRKIRVKKIKNTEEILRFVALQGNSSFIWAIADQIAIKPNNANKSFTTIKLSIYIKSPLFLKSAPTAALTAFTFQRNTVRNYLS